MLFGQEPGAEATLAAVVSAGALLKQGVEAIAQRRQLGGQPVQVMILLEVDAVGGKDLARYLQESHSAPVTAIPPKSSPSSSFAAACPREGSIR